MNDIHGHGAGDALLVIVAQRLATCIGDGDLVARLGGDEFAILARHLMPEAATSIALRIMQALDEPVAVGKVSHQIGTGIGIALIPDDAASYEEAMRRADVALYRAKSERRSALRFFEEEMDRHVRERDQLDQRLRAAIASSAIEVTFQPVVNLLSNEIRGFEVIPFWRDEILGRVPADRFTPLAEESGLIHALFEDLLTQACRAAAQWPAHITLAIDVVATQLKNAQLSRRILEILQQTGIAPDRLELEITESALVGNLENAQHALGSLRAAGVRIVLDNFGTGYSSLYHLRSFDFDKIKIDRGFIENLEAENTAGIVRALVGLGHGLGLEVSAEGVCDWDQTASLVNTGCKNGQGQLFGVGLSAEDAALAFFPCPHEANLAATWNGTGVAIEGS